MLIFTILSTSIARGHRSPSFTITVAETSCLVIVSFFKFHSSISSIITSKSRLITDLESSISYVNTMNLRFRSVNSNSISGSDKENLIHSWFKIRFFWIISFLTITPSENIISWFLEFDIFSSYDIISSLNCFIRSC